MTEREGGFLVRDGDARAAKARRHDAAHRDGEILRLNRQRHQRAVDPHLLQPEAVEPRRKGLRDRPAHDASDPGGARDRHVVSTPCLRSSASSGCKARPRMEK